MLNLSMFDYVLPPTLLHTTHISESRGVNKSDVFFLLLPAENAGESKRINKSNIYF